MNTAQVQLSRSGEDDALRGADEIAAMLGHKARWLRRLRRECPDVPIKQLPGGGLIASKQQLLEWVRRLPTAVMGEDGDEK